MLWLAAAFLVTALLYASVGFGGGSTYTALLALAGLDYRLIPLVSLACNILVVAGATVRFARAGLIPWRGALLLTTLGAPAAFAGGLVELDEASFIALLGAALVVSAAALLVPVRAADGSQPTCAAPVVPFAAAPLAFLAGMVGIGGGIFLAPLLHLTRWAPARQVAATASLFILVNSLFGLGGQLAKGGLGLFAAAIAGALPLLLAVVVGGQVGSLLAQRVLPARWIRLLTAALTLWVGVRLLVAP